MTQKHPLVYLTIALCSMFLAISSPASGQTGVQPLFASNSVLDVRIDAPITRLMKERPDEEYLDGTFSYTDAAGQDHMFDLKLRTRGKFRRQPSTCQFAPIRLNFKKGQLEGTDFDGQDKLKLVTHCQTKKTQYEQLVLREYLTYRILQTLTDHSFGSRLMRITYADSEGDEPFTRYGFVIEDEDDIGERLGLTKLNSSGLSYGELDDPHANMVIMYEYLIGNTDFSLVRGPTENDCCHNASPFSDGTIVKSIPYDFDHAGLIDAPYAKPNPQFKTNSVRTRVYRGRCSNNEILPDTLSYFLSKQAEIMALVDELTDLDKKNRKQVVGYLDDFFEIIADPKKIERNLIKKCS